MGVDIENRQKLKKSRAGENCGRRYKKKGETRVIHLTDVTAERLVNRHLHSLFLFLLGSHILRFKHIGFYIYLSFCFTLLTSVMVCRTAFLVQIYLFSLENHEIPFKLSHNSQRILFHAIVFYSYKRCNIANFKITTYINPILLENSSPLKRYLFSCYIFWLIIILFRLFHQ